MSSRRQTKDDLEYELRQVKEELAHTKQRLEDQINRNLLSEADKTCYRIAKSLGTCGDDVDALTLTLRTACSTSPEMVKLVDRLDRDMAQGVADKKAFNEKIQELERWLERIAPLRGSCYNCN